MTQNPLLNPAGWSGVWTALITPLEGSDANLKLDSESLKSLIDSQISAGVRGLVIAGSTGEGSLLDPSLYEELLITAYKIAAGRIPLVAGLGIGGTQSCLQNLRLAKKIGYQGVLAAPPAYIKAPQQGLINHFLRLAAEEIPVCLYEISGRAATSIDISTLARLAQDASPHAKFLVAIKDASANLQRALDTKRLCGDRFAMLSGDDGTFVSFLASGGVGVISVVSHLTPRSLIEILNSAKSSELTLATQGQCRINPLVEGLFWESNPIPVKSLLHKLEKIKNPQFCAPLLPMSKDKLANLVELAKKTGDLK